MPSPSDVLDPYYENGTLYIRRLSAADTDDTEEFPTVAISFEMGDDGALVLFIDTSNGPEPTPDVLRVNVNDGPAWNYPDEGTQGY